MCSIAVLFWDLTDTAASQLKFYFELSTAYCVELIFNTKQRVSYAALCIVVTWVISSKEEKIRKYKDHTKTTMVQYFFANLNATGKYRAKIYLRNSICPQPQVSL